MNIRAKRLTPDERLTLESAREVVRSWPEPLIATAVQDATRPYAIGALEATDDDGGHQRLAVIATFEYATDAVAVLAMAKVLKKLKLQGEK